MEWLDLRVFREQGTKKDLIFNKNPSRQAKEPRLRHGERRKGPSWPPKGLQLSCSGGYCRVSSTRERLVVGA